MPRPRTRRSGSRKGGVGGSGSRKGKASSGVGGTRQPRGRTGDGNGPNRRKDAENKSKNSSGIGAALGITAAAAAAIGAAALTAFASSDGADIEFTSITTEQSTDSFVPDFFQNLWNSVSTPVNLEFTWKYKGNPQNPLAIPSAVRIVEGDQIDLFDLPEPLAAMNGTGDHKVLKVKGDNVFVIKSTLRDTSDVNIQNKGRGTIQTNYEDQLDQTAADAAGGVGDLLGKAGAGFLNHIGTFVFFIIVFIAVFYGIKFLSSMKKQSNSPGPGNINVKTNNN
jgi:hypothetical protein